MKQNDFGLMGLAVMGQNLVLNVESRGFPVSVFNRTTSKMDDFLKHSCRGRKIDGFSDLSAFVQSLKKPRKIMLMVKAGEAVDEFIDKLLPMIDKGDILIDGGNSFFPDTIRRSKFLASRGILYVGAGVSGGEEGALKGPSIMPGGQKEAYDAVAPILLAISAKVQGEPCCAYIGPDGAGHYVKMVHNGIEYGDMQLISEAYYIMRNALGMEADELHKTFARWNKSDLDSYLIQITSDIFARIDPDTGLPLVELIKDERVAASKVLKGPLGKYRGDRKAFVEAIRQALFASKICSYAQGFALMRAAGKEYHWSLNFGEISMIWRGGCIIRAQFLQRIKDAFRKSPDLPNLLLDPYFKKVVEKSQDNWRKVIVAATRLGIPVQAFSSALAYFDSYRREKLCANLIQAQRDYFGAHTYERLDKPGVFHTDWLAES